LNNSVRHAKASQIDVRLSGGDGFLELLIHDNGRGSPDINYPSGGNQDKMETGVGLQSMRYRADQLGADFRIVSSQDAGTSVILRWKK
ncbi:MAG: hypothetical protein IJU95_08580, partial [Treponema sp.]|nr:hypothetical protein [Treponema sp.]